VFDLNLSNLPKMAASDVPSSEDYQKGLEALSSLISGRVRADGKNWSHAFEMMQKYLEVRDRFK